MPACSQELATSQTVARCMSRFQRRSSNSVPRCMVQRLSQIDEIVHTPAVSVDELALRGVRDELVDQRAAFGFGMPRMRPACDAR